MKLKEVIFFNFLFMVMLKNQKNLFRWNAVEAPKFLFFGLFRNCLNCDSLRWSHTHFRIYFPAHLAKTVSYTTIKLYLFAVHDLHRQSNIPCKLPKMYRLQKVLNGIKRSQTPAKLDRYPITIQILNSIFQLLPTSPQYQYRPHNVVGCLYLSLFLPFGVQVNSFVTVAPLTLPSFPSSRYHLHSFPRIPKVHASAIKQSKTDPFRKGCTLTIARSTTSICSVMAMRDYLLQRNATPTGPLFTFTNGRWLTRANLTKELRSALNHCGLPAERYYSDSFRIGEATSAAAAAGVPAWLIKVLGRWSSDCYERYIRTPQETPLSIPKTMSIVHSKE